MNLVVLLPEDFRQDRQSVTLTGRRAIHIHRIHRVKAGDSLRVGLLNGPLGSGTILATTDDAVTMTVSLSEAPGSLRPVTLLVALPRPKVLRRVLQAAAAFGVSRIVLMESWRVEKGFWGSASLKESALREQLILGLEQGTDTQLPEILLRRRFRPFAEDELPVLAIGSLALLAHPGGTRICPSQVLEPLCLAVGPEGGFIPYEVALFERAGFIPVHLGKRILRVDQAVPALLGRLL